MKRLTILAIIFLSLVFLNLHIYSAQKKAVNKTFKLEEIVKIKTVNGDIRIKKSDGDIMVRTASGDIDINGSKGVFKVKCASGNFNAGGIVLQETSTFKTASGEIRVRLAKTSEHDMDLVSASGNITLDYNGNPVQGYFKFKGKRRNINSDIPFDNEDESYEYSPFVKRYFKKGGGSPVVTLQTVSGELAFKK
jgi:DUF4097 and DUF4098 domain-containing protein YvlB